MQTTFRVIPAILAILCVLAVVPWTLGVPGVDNDYARGWSIGYQAIVFYIVGYGLLVAIGLVTRIARRPLPKLWLNAAGMAMVLAFAIAQLVAWPLILSSA